MGYQTLADDNQFRFKCPIFGAETKMSSCIKLRTLFWKGRRPDQRKGCQACMEAGKCPAAVIAQRMALSNPRNPVADEYGSTTSVMGKLRQDILARILPTMVMPGLLTRHGVSSKEAAAIETANDRIRAMMGSAPAGTTGTKATIKGKTRKNRKLVSPKATTPEATQAAPSKIEKAAATGDLSAAI
jgi:hypothetical protein